MSARRQRACSRRAWRGETAQAEALPPDTLAELVRNAIEAYVDIDVHKQHVEVEGRERVELTRALPAGGGSA
jgi:hypothetical protein